MDNPLRRPTAMLRLALLLDAGVVAVAGLALAIGANPVGDLLGLDPVFLRTVGIALLPWAAWVGWAGKHPISATVRTVIAGNTLWVIASVLVLVVQAITPNGFGIALVLLQAMLVAAIAWWQGTSLRSLRIA